MAGLGPDGKPLEKKKDWAGVLTNERIVKPTAKVGKTWGGRWRRGYNRRR